MSRVLSLTLVRAYRGSTMHDLAGVVSSRVVLASKLRYRGCAAVGEAKLRVEKS